MAVRRPWLMVSSIDSYLHAQPWQPVPAYTISFLYVQCKSKAGVSSTSASNSLDERARCANSQLSRESSQNMSVEIFTWMAVSGNAAGILAFQSTTTERLSTNL